MKIRFRIISEISRNLEDFPGAKTPEEALKMQKEEIKEWDFSAEDVVGEDFDFQIELIE